MSLQSYRAGESLFLKAWFHNYMLSANQPDQRKHNEKESTTKLCNNKNQRNTNSSQTHKESLEKLDIELQRSNKHNYVSLPKVQKKQQQHAQTVEPFC